MRSILFKLSDSEAADFEIVRSRSGGVKLSPRKFFLDAVKREVDKLLDGVADEAPEGGDS